MIEKANGQDLLGYIGIIAFGLTCYVLYDYLKACFLAFRLNGPKALPILGNCLIIKEKTVLSKYAANAYEMYGRLVRIWITLVPCFIVCEPHDLQIILSSKKHTEKVFFYKLLHNFLGNGLITSSGDTWSTHRKLIQPMFHMSILEKFIETFADASLCLLDKLNAAPKELNIATFVNNCVIDILNEAVLGVPCRKKNGVNMEDSPFRKGQVTVPFRVTRPWLLLDFLYKMTATAAAELNQKKSLDDFTKKMIKIRREAMENGEFTDRKSLLDYMIEISASHPEFTEDDIVNEACTFMLAGQDSVGAAVAFTLFLLAQNPNDQKKCIEEIDNIFDSDDRAPTMNDLREMRYVEMCIKEALRMYPSVPLVARKIAEDIPVGKHVLPAGANIFILPYTTHRLKHIYPDPETFLPERFSTENSEKRHPYAFIPFSAGPRNCIGHKFAIIEMKTVISKVLRHYQLLPVPGKTTFEPLFRITVRASGGLWVRLQSRGATVECK